MKSKGKGRVPKGPSIKNAIVNFIWKKKGCPVEAGYYLTAATQNVASKKENES